ncbi:MAG: thioredoxin domain-containing protein [Cellulomonadaceae bacterium]
MANRLASALSPYLRQHADNPVDWREWSHEAFAEARDRDVPVLVSIGYAACHWCHVMAHESFEDEATAEQLNAGFVSVKVDRDERPDVDAAFMAAVVAGTGHGGWPMTVFCTPDGEPFFAGTYFPAVPTAGLPSFRQVLTAVGEAWTHRRGDLLTHAGALVEQLRARPAAAEGRLPTAAELDATVRLLRREYDDARGGFGSAPKFPPSMTLVQLLRHHARTGSADALAMAAGTAEAMARGGIYDQLSGGFARYCVDAGWVVPHFEKMAYDNAQLLGVYALLWRATGAGWARRVALETATFLLDELRTDAGAFASSLDADTDGVEGRFSTWTPQQLTRVLGAEDGAWAAEVLSATPTGTFEGGASTLQLRRDPDPDRWQRVRAALRTARDLRAHPGRDDTVVAAWNGLAIGSLAEAGMILERPELVEAASAAAAHVLALHWDARPEVRVLRRVSLGDRVGPGEGALDDYALLADGLITLFSATGRMEWFDTAGQLLDVAQERFCDGAEVFDAAIRHRHGEGVESPAPFLRPADPADTASPAGRSALAGALLRYGALAGSSTHRRAAEAALSAYTPLAARAPRFAGWGLAVAEALVDGPREVAISAGTGAQDLVRAFWRTPTAGAVLAVALPRNRSDAPADPVVALLAGRGPLEGRATAAVCRRFVCRRPVTGAGELAELLTAP